jgi:hypothetical protein
LKKGRAATMTQDYKRNGTTTLFAALDARRASSSASANRGTVHALRSSRMPSTTIDRHNADPKPFVWTKSAEVILTKERRALDALEAINSGYQPLDSEHSHVPSQAHRTR